MLNEKEIHWILEKCSERTLVSPTKEFPYRISEQGRGYSDDQFVASLQAKLSIMLGVFSK